MSDAARIFRALADPTRRQILQDLKDRPMAAGEIVAMFDMSGPTISRHLAVLSAAGLVASRREANRIVYSLVPETLAHAVGDFLSSVCPTQVLAVRRRKKRRT